MPLDPSNPPTQIDQPLGAIPSYIVANGAAVSVINPLPTTTGGATTSSVTTNYICIAAFIDANGAVALNDQLINLQIFNSLGTLVTDVWNDVTASFTLANPPPSGKVEIYIPGGGATAANQTLEIAELTSISNQLPQALGTQTIANSMAVNIASNQVVPVSATALPLPTGAATAANQATEISSLATIATKTTSLVNQLPATLGQTNLAGSLSVALASNQVLPLPTGAATAALQTTGNTSLATIATETTAISAQLPAVLGQTTAAGSLSTVLASNATLPLPTGAATSALQTTGNTSLSTIATNSTAITGQLPPALGLQPAGSSLSVVVANSPSGDISASALFVASALGTGYSIGDVIQKISVYVPGTPNVFVSATWNNLTTGLPISAPPAGDLTPVTGGSGGSSGGTSSTLYVASATTAEFNTGDSIERVDVYDPAGAVVATIWNNLTQQTVIGVPAAGNLTPQTSQLPPALAPGNALSVFVQNPGGSSSSTTNTYTVTTGFTDGSQPIAVNDILQQILVFNSSGVLSATIWFDVTLAYTLVGTPPAGDIALVASSTATSANQTTQITQATTTNNTLSTISSQIPTTLGQKTKANSMSVAIASDNTVATSSVQLPSALGQTISAGSVSTVLASDATLPLPTGAATAALQTSGNTSLSTIATETTIAANTLGTITGQLPPTLGLQTPSNSLSVAVANSIPVDVTTTFLYTVVTGWSTASAGNIVARYDIYTPGAPPTLVSETWFNVSTGATVATAPPNYTYVTPLTNGGGSGGGSPAVEVLYTANTNGTGFNAGDQIQLVSIIDATTGATTIEVWNNLTQGTVISPAPSYVDLTYLDQQLPPALGLQAAASSLSVVIADATSLTPDLITTSTTGTTTAGAKTLSFANNGTSPVTIGSATLPAGAALDFAAPAGSTIGSISYDATGSNLLIATLY